MHLILRIFSTKVILQYESEIAQYMICLFCFEHVNFFYSTTGSRQMFNISWLVGGHPILNSAMLMSEASRTFGILLDLIQAAGRLPGALTITVVSWYVSGCIHYSCVFTFLSVLHDVSFAW